MNARNLNVKSDAVLSRRTGQPFDHNMHIVHRSLPVRFLKGLLTFARATGPHWLYVAFYQVGFASWRGALRLLYGRKVVGAWRRGDPEGLEMYRTIRKAL